MNAPDALLDVLCPMHARLDSEGRIRHAGPTLAKLSPEAPISGSAFLDIFEIARPRTVEDMEGLLATAGTKLHLRLRARPETKLKAVLVPLPQGRGAVVNLSFGISILDGVRSYALTSADFAPTDLAVEMLYLLEAKSAAMAASRTLNLRLQAARIAAEEQAFTDTLTGLKNRRALEHVLARMAASGIPFALTQIDLDYFKQVNDSLGHPAGDQVLQVVARILVEETRARDTAARIGGDEFVLLLEAPKDRAAVAEVARRIIDRLGRPIPVGERHARIAASAGSVMSEDYAAPDPARLLADADAALYAAKKAGRARHRFGAPARRPPGHGLQEEDGPC